MSTIIAILNGLRVSEKGTIQSIQVRPLPDGMELIAPVPNFAWEDFNDVEDVLSRIVDALSIYYHVPNEIGINRSWFPLPSSESDHEIVVDLDRLKTVHTMLNTSSSSKILRAVLRVVQRADQCEKWSDRLLLLWMAFNTLYSTSKRSAERSKIANYVGDRHFTVGEVKPWVDDLQAKGGFEGLITSSLTLYKWNMSVIFIAEELSEALEKVVKSGDGYLQFMSKLLLTVYALRNRFFYDDEELQAEQIDETQLASAIVTASLTLDFVIRASIQKRLDLEVTGPLSQAPGATLGGSPGQQ